MRDITILVIVALGLAALYLAIRGSLRRDREFERRYSEASELDRAKLEASRPRTSWQWLNLHSTSRHWTIAWVIALMAGGVIVAFLKWGGH